jgi:K+-transporting ATPase KdpF subunit
MHRSLLLADAAGRVDDAPGPGAHGRQLAVRQKPGEAALMTAYIVTGIVALIVTLYLFVALLFPERF